MANTCCITICCSIAGYFDGAGAAIQCHRDLLHVLAIAPEPIPFQLSLCECGLDALATLCWDHLCRAIDVNNTLLAKRHKPVDSQSNATARQQTFQCTARGCTVVAWQACCVLDPFTVSRLVQKASGCAHPSNATAEQVNNLQKKCYCLTWLHSCCLQASPASLQCASGPA